MLLYGTIAGCAGENVWLNAEHNRGSTKNSPAEQHLQEPWNDWARDHIRDSDIVFLMTRTPVLFGLVDLSDFAAEIANSQYTHTGIAAIENGTVYVYDIGFKGVRRITFGGYVCKYHRAFGVKRLKPGYRDRIPVILQYCRDVYCRNVSFDYGFTAGDDRLYCTEFTEHAFRASGLPLSAPVRVDELPRFYDFPVLTTVAELTTDLRRDQEFFIAGNESIGIWSSPKLDFVAAADHTCMVPADVPIHGLMGELSLLADE